MASQDLIDHYKLDVQFHPDHTRHVSYASDRARRLRKDRLEKKWYRVKRLGRGGYSVVWLEIERESESSSERAVKEVPKKGFAGSHIDYRKELLALAKFSNPKVWPSYTERCLA